MIPRYARWTDDEVAELRRLFPDHTAREISERTGRGVRSIERQKIATGTLERQGNVTRHIAR